MSFRSFFRSAAQYTLPGMASNAARGRNPFNPGGTGNQGYGNDYMNAGIQHSEQTPLSGLQFDSGGFPIGQYGPPSARVALGYQYEAEKNAAQRQQAAFGDAQAALAQGAHVMESYRPGGAVALRSGLYGQQAQLNYNIGSQIQAPDMLADYRRDQGAQAQRAAGQASRNQILGGIIQAGATIAGAAIGGPVGGAVGGLIGGQAAGQLGGGQAAQSNLGPGVGSSPAGPSGGGITPQAPSYAPGPIGAEPPGTSLPPPGGGTAQARLGGGGGSPGPSSGPGGPPGGGGPSGGGGEDRPGPGGGGGGGAAMARGFGTDMNFMPAAAAAAGARQLGPINDHIMVQVAAQEHDWAFWEAANDAVDRQLELAIHGMMGAN